MPAYDLRPAGVDGGALDQCAALLGPVLGPSLDRAYLPWLYAGNPAGSVVGFNAFHADVLAAHYATIPVAAWVDGRLAKGVLSLNTATHPSHQGNGLFPRLAERTYEHAASLGHEFVVGVANARSTPGFIAKLGFQLVAPLDVGVGVGGASPKPDRDRYGYYPHWTDDAIAWRLRRPGARYVAGRAHGGERDVFARVSAIGLLARLDRLPARSADRLPSPPRVAPLRLRIGLDRAAAARGVLLPVPDSLKPSPLNLIFRDLTAQRRTLDANHVRWTLLDFDAY